MCTNRALVNSLECYMDDLVDSFEDFVKKSLILISVGVASVVVMLVYMLKVVTDRAGTPDTADSRGQAIQPCQSAISIPKTPSHRHTVKSGFILCSEPKLTCTSVNTVPISPAPSFDERVLKDIGLTNCNRDCDLSTRSMLTDSPRRSISSLPTCVPKRMCIHNNRRVSPQPHALSSNETSPDLSCLTAMAAKYFWTAYSTMNGNYMAIATVFIIVLLSFIIPDLSQKIHRNSELKAIKKMVNVMSKKVSRAEVACFTVADEICCLHCSMHDGTTETLKDQQDLSVCTSGCMRTTRSEPVQVEKIGFFRRIFFPKKNTSHKEVTIMSYLYTDSFDAAKSFTDSSIPSDYTIN